jgi:hypothetical protein
MILSIFLHESPSSPVNEIHDPNKVANAAEMGVSSLMEIEGNNQINLKPKYPNQQETALLLTEDEKLNINKMMKYYQSSMPGQPLELIERYLIDYLKIHLALEKFEEAKKATANLIEYERSFMEIENNYKNSSISEAERKEWLNNLKLDIQEKFLQKDSRSLYALTE